MRICLRWVALALLAAGCAEGPRGAETAGPMVIPEAVIDQAFIPTRDNFVGNWRGRVMGGGDTEPEVSFLLSFLEAQGQALGQGHGRWQGAGVNVVLDEDMLLITPSTGEKVVLWQVSRTRLEGTYLAPGSSVTRSVVLLRR